MRVRINSLGYSITLMSSGVGVLVTGYLFQMYLMPDWTFVMAEVTYTTRLVIVVV